MNARVDCLKLHAPRLGMSVLEMSMALLILTFAIGGLVQILTMAASHRRTTEVRRLAVQELANQAEHIALLSWDQLTPEKLAERKVANSLIAAAPSAKLSVALVDDAGPPIAKRIQLEVTWNAPDGDPVEPVRLAVWRHQPTEAQP
jgi:Tfp pilus assembly protein PilV